MFICACKPFARGGVSVVSRSAVSTLSLTLQAVLLFTMWALHPRELSIIVACIKYVKDLCCIGGVVVAHPLHCKDKTNCLIDNRHQTIYTNDLCKSLIFSVKNFRIEPACALLLRLSWCVQPPVTSPKGFTSRAYYIMHAVGRVEFRCNIRPALLRV